MQTDIIAEQEAQIAAVQSTLQNDLIIKDLGLIPYKEAWDLQKKIQRSLIDNAGAPHLLLCEHPPVITFGRSASQNNLLVSKDLLHEKGVESYEIERGGDVTYHGPGQLVAYPLLDLKQHRKDVGWFMRTLEQIILNTLAAIEVPATTIEGKTGVWIPREDGSTEPERKIASIGIRISRWCTMHGLSLNVSENLDGFSLIHPCGFNDIEITSVEQELARRDTVPPLFSEIKSLIVHEFCETFGYGRKK